MQEHLKVRLIFSCLEMKAMMITVCKNTYEICFQTSWAFLFFKENIKRAETDVSQE